MSTPIETNTEELQEILQTVYNLPNRSSGGSAEPDLVIGSTSGWLDSTTASDTFYIKSGDISTVVEKLKQGINPIVTFSIVQAYDEKEWAKTISYARDVSLLFYNTENPSTDNPAYLKVLFVIQNVVTRDFEHYRISVRFNLDTGAITTNIKRAYD